MAKDKRAAEPSESTQSIHGFDNFSPDPARMAELAAEQEAQGETVVQGVAPEPPPTDESLQVAQAGLEQADGLYQAKQLLASEGLRVADTRAVGDVNWIIAQGDEGPERHFRVGPGGELIEEEAPPLADSAQVVEQEALAVESAPDEGTP